jgi:two-component system chemotaxis response regulator CheY
MAYNILIVDDSPVARRVVRRAVDMSGLDVGRVLEATDGVEALGILSAEWMDVVFADLNMPRMTGHEMIARMAESNLLASVPVIVVSAERNEARMEALIRLGARAYITKPLTPEAIHDVVVELFQTGEEART